MSRRYFGTDGVRGRVGEFPLTSDFALRLASAAAQVLNLAGQSVVIGHDTRESAPMFEAALTAGFLAAGVDVRSSGPLPTPAISHMVTRCGAGLGTVISASHNPAADNGIKFFDATGGKLSDATELAIENALDEPVLTAESARLGRVLPLADAAQRYGEFCTGLLPHGTDVSHLRAVVDCANGATAVIAPQVLDAMLKETIPIGACPSGRNINEGCGSTSPGLLAETVLAERADFGIAFDGDGDRLLMVDHTGTVIDGDQLLYILATHLHARGELTGPVVGTVMSNMGLEQALRDRGIEFVRTKVGDRYVLETLSDRGGVLGGESSGHLLMLDKTPTGDALAAAIVVLGVLSDTGAKLAELAAPMPRYLQILESVRVPAHFDLTNEPGVSAAQNQAVTRLGEAGRVVLRASGTEPVIRVMVEGRDEPLVRELADELVAAVRAAT
ncbi:phosphoglucosamine mutase [Nocardia vermiculata]|uniref:Phosphoglucosamine mutase n=1 Tax=Nocardia vermiculata TaxID=257274 RepID=A0A846Y345_9NOCA|nr:phosphoglucosamine mutase [Nocardia vermiculata]NKY53936.1 phosphoglucosamine mutase [Nocardia vermiculata]